MNLEQKRPATLWMAEVGRDLGGRTVWAGQSRPNLSRTGQKRQGVRTHQNQTGQKRVMKAPQKGRLDQEQIQQNRSMSACPQTLATCT
jgi:hypothetical protein